MAAPTAGAFAPGPGQTFWITLAATFLATLPAVYFGLRWERSFSRRIDLKRRREYLFSGGTAGSWESIVYDIRDWAGQLVQYFEGVSPFDGLILGVGRVPGIETIPYMFASGVVPTYYRTRMLLLADYGRLLNDAFVIVITGSAGLLTDEVRGNLARLAEAVRRTADDLVHDPDLQKELHKELAPLPIRLLSSIVTFMHE